MVQTVSASVSRTANRLTVALSRVSKPGHVEGRLKKSAPGLSVIKESESSMGLSQDSLLEITPPQWTSPGWFDMVLEAEGTCPDVVLHSHSTLNEMMDADDNIKLSVTKLIIHARSRPFAQGSLRTASYARAGASNSRFVVKAYKDEGETCGFKLYVKPSLSNSMVCSRQSIQSTLFQRHACGSRRKLSRECNTNHWNPGLRETTSSITVMPCGSTRNYETIQ